MLLQSVQSFISPDFVSKASRLVGDSPDGVRSSLKSAVPTLLSGIAHRGSTPEGAEHVLGLIREGGYEAGVPSNYIDHLSNDASAERFMRKGNGLLSGIFGNQLSSVTGALGDSGKSTKLLSLLAPLALGSIGSMVRKNGWGASQLSGFLGQEKAGLASMLPAGVGKVFGAHERPTTYAKPEIVREREAPQVYRSSSDIDLGGEAHHRKRSIAMPLAILALLGIGGWYLMKNRQAEHRMEQAGQAIQNVQKPAAPEVAQPQAQQPQAEQPQAQQPESDTQAPAMKFRTGAGQALSAAVASGSNVSLPATIPLDSLKFAPSSTKLSDAGNQELAEVASVLKSHPSAEVKIVGSTDNTGDQAKNEKLSMQRAIAVKDALTQKGASADQLQVASAPSQGEGADFRRTDLMLTQR